MTLEIYRVSEEEDQFSFHHHQGRNPHMLALNQKLQQPTVIQKNIPRLKNQSDLIETTLNSPQFEELIFSEDYTLKKPICAK
jgi:hypothetical protein